MMLKMDDSFVVDWTRRAVPDDDISLDADESDEDDDKLRSRVATRHDDLQDHPTISASDRVYDYFPRPKPIASDCFVRLANERLDQQVIFDLPSTRIDDDRSIRDLMWHVAAKMTHDVAHDVNC
jgi:hypothetical protein